MTTYAEYVSQAQAWWESDEDDVSPYICDCLCRVVDIEHTEKGEACDFAYPEIAPLINYVGDKLNGAFGVEAFLFKKARYDITDDEAEYAEAFRKELWAELRELSAKLDIQRALATAEA